jgi:hypothetical protein
MRTWMLACLQFVTSAKIDSAPAITFLWVETFPLKVRAAMGVLPPSRAPSRICPEACPQACPARLPARLPL